MDDLIKKLRETADTSELTFTSKTVEPHAELKAMYEQQVKDGTVLIFWVAVSGFVFVATYALPCFWRKST